MTPLAPPPAPTEAPAPVQPIRLPDRRGLPAGTRLLYLDVTWAEYVALRRSPAADRLKITFDGPTGRLEVEMPQGPRHESVSRMLSYFVMAFRRAGGPPFRSAGAVTLRRADLARGAEPDESFYVKNIDAAPDLDGNALDLTDGSPPPDVCVEVDVTSPGVSKLPIYAALGVPEVWVWDEAAGTLTVRRLAGDAYEEAAGSGELPGFPVAEAAALLADRGGRDDGALQEAFEAVLRGVGPLSPAAG